MTPLHHFYWHGWRYPDRPYNFTGTLQSRPLTTNRKRSRSGRPPVAPRPLPAHPPAGSWAAAGAGRPCRLSPRPPGRAAGRGAETAVYASRQGRGTDSLTAAASRPPRRRGLSASPFSSRRAAVTPPPAAGGACRCCRGDGPGAITPPTWRRGGWALTWPAAWLRLEWLRPLPENPCGRLRGFFFADISGEALTMNGICRQKGPRSDKPTAAWVLVVVKVEPPFAQNWCSERASCEQIKSRMDKERPRWKYILPDWSKGQFLSKLWVNLKIVY